MCNQDLNETALEPSTASDSFPWHIGAFDAHNHLGEYQSQAADASKMRSRCLAVMATRGQDQAVVKKLADHMGLRELNELSQEGLTTVLPGFGRHPWFSHELYNDTCTEPTFDEALAVVDLEAAKQKHYAAILSAPEPESAFVADLPTPQSLSSFVQETRERLLRHPLAIVGEIGLDRGFRLPMQWEAEAKAAANPSRTPGGRMRRPLSRHSISIEHQTAVLEAHLRLAGELSRAVSVHGVQVHGTLFDVLVRSWKGSEKKSQRLQKKDKSQGPIQTESPRSFPPRICLHSFSGKADAARQYLNPKFPSLIYFSFSRTNNMRDESGLSKMRDALRIVPDDRLLVESDIHIPGERMDADIEIVYRIICSEKQWTLEEGVQRVANNWRNFVFGHK